MDAKKRKEIIQELIQEQLIEDQSTLVELLKKKGVKTHQVQVSRDLKELGIGKQKINGRMAYELPDNNQVKQMLQLASVNVTCNETMIVVHTMPGFAPFVGDYLDTQKDVGILGTIAGETAVFVVPTSTKKIKSICKEVAKCLYSKKDANQ